MNLDILSMGGLERHGSSSDSIIIISSSSSSSSHYLLPMRLFSSVSHFPNGGKRPFASLIP